MDAEEPLRKIYNGEYDIGSIANKLDKTKGSFVLLFIIFVGGKGNNHHDFGLLKFRLQWLNNQWPPPNLRLLSLDTSEALTKFQDARVDVDAFLWVDVAKLFISSQIQ